MVLEGRTTMELVDPLTDEIVDFNPSLYPIGTAVLMILTIGGLGIWVVIDLVILIVGGFTDAEGRKITEWV